MFLPINFFKKTFFVCNFILLFSIHSLHAQEWQLLGTSPSTLITGIYACKTSPVIIISTLKNGIFKSYDSGKSWLNVSNNEDSLFTLVAYSDKYLLAGGKGKVYKSIDSGSTWTASSIPYRIAVGKIAFHNSSKIIIGTGSVWDFENLGNGNGILLSTDSAETWTTKNTGFGKDNLLVQSLAVAPDGNIFAGVHDEKTGSEGRFGVFHSANGGESWQRLIINIDAPYSVKYSNDKLKVNNVFNIAIEDGIILAAINGVYSNFGYGFTVKCKVSDVTNQNNKWNVHWVDDSLALTGSYYKQTNSLYKDSQGTYWASISPPERETSNNIYSDKDFVSKSWNNSMDGLLESYGRFMFTEDGSGNLYTVSYFGNQIFVKSIFGPSSINRLEQLAFSIYPLPASSFITIAGSFRGPINIRILDITGKEVLKRENANFSGEKFIMQLPLMLQEGIYLLEVSDETTKSIKQIFLNRD
ncbi:MAG: T9SS type A sorting domain-containing protein [Sporocytophaga sp.]|uniref:VPS10 domain-containing protein n=1 Tax=Sporocytophaga sp. TaxID=2231183 RepID=UPI001B276105|nr:T9SS type A sorting domain-containing protein [Sporocytophaga sp.]MBO9701694.1 T9SS type A sorting domain-containing protein [Sporocytophaga sp.]